MEPSEIDRRFAQSIIGEYDDERAWNAISSLQRDGCREIFERAGAWCLSDDPMKRARGLNILSQLRSSSSADPMKPQWMFRDEAFRLIIEMLPQERTPLVLASAVNALGHLGNETGIPIILGFLDHADGDVRFEVSVALGQFADDPRSTDGLLTLTLDPDSDVRDWAVFGLGVLGDADSPGIREALLRCLDDVDQDVREEAAVGLGKRHDPRVLPKLIEMLTEPDFSGRVTDAACALLELNQDPPDWRGEDYLSALRCRFNPFA